MKHVALACALLATACGAAQAQTNVTIYGVLDAGVEHLSNVGGNGSLTRMPGLGVSVPSRLGFRGTEDLGGGLKAILRWNLASARTVALSIKEVASLGAKLS